MGDEYKDYAPPDSGKGEVGPFLARVVGHFEPSYMGTLEVEILRPVGNNSDAGRTINARMLTPFGGQTGEAYIGNDPDDYNNTQKSYGMWFVPPDVGTLVMVIFVQGNIKDCFWIGCVADDFMNFMVPGIAATEFNVEKSNPKYPRVPVAEYNKQINGKVTDPTKVPKPEHPFTSVLQLQGLLKDDIRGITTSSARRELPSSVFGISTPGPVDKTSGAKTGAVGKKGQQAENVPVSRLGGTTFVMDDGDDKYLRKTPAFSGPPEYAAVSQNETGGNVTIPHNELVRIRTRTGHQILLHNSEDLIYIGNAGGTTWIELTSNGKIDIYAKDSISIHTEADLNIRADRDINMEAGRNINMKAVTGRVQVETKTNLNLIVGASGVITTAGSLQINTAGANNFTSTGATNIKSSANINLTASADLNLKAGAKLTQNASGYYSLPGTGGTAPVSATASTATKATALSMFANPTNALDQNSSIMSIMKRVPTFEPYPHHENLDPISFASIKTDRESSAAIATPGKWFTYTTATDPFRKERGAQ